MRVLVAAAIALLLTAADARADDLTVLGIQIGAPLSFQSCPPQVNSENWSIFNPNLKLTAPCVSPDLQRRPNYVRVFHPNGTIPNWVHPGVTVLTDASGVQVVTISTWGIRRQGDVMDDLKAKFGEPAQTENETAKNAVGGSFDVTLAKWSLPDATTVLFEGATFDLDHGIVVIVTKAGDDEVKSQARASRGPGL